MAVSIDKARHYVYGNGALWERAMFAFLFDGEDASRVEACLLNYKNADGGFGHGFEADIKCPDSHPLALEFMLTVLRITGVPHGRILEGTADWVERNRKENGSLLNPPALHAYPYAPWWSGGGQSDPDSIVGNLARLGAATPSLMESTARWAGGHLSASQIKGIDWLFLCYHPVDYYFGIPRTAETEPLREATARAVVACASKAEEKQLHTLFSLAPGPDSPLGCMLPRDLLDRCLDHAERTQREDGGWADEHGLPHWQPWTTIVNLLALKNYGRL